MKTAFEIACELSDKLYPLNAKEVEALSSVIESRKVASGQVLLDDGEYAHNINYVESGLLRQFYFKNGHEITEHFGCPNDIVFCIESLFKHEATHLMIEAVENSEIHSIHYDEMVGLFESMPNIANICRHLLQNALIRSQEKADSWRFESARTRYERFIDDFPYAATHAKLNDIASYLLMTPESLSRIRAGVL